MTDDKPKRPIRWWRLWPIVGFAGLAAWEFTAAYTEGRPVEWVWIGIAGAAILFVIYLRVFMRV
ncbi:MAG: hypothetical protein KDB82_13050 [Planctomycetes bacterium]|mgnify:FL=1|nr:hypothetical protein [Planctomycetota bacterium]